MKNKIFNWTISNLWIILILIIGTILRLYHLDFQGVWIDELHTLKESDPNITFKELFYEVNFREGIPHFYFLLVRFFGTIFGFSIYSIRLFSVLFGVLGIFLLFLLGKNISNKQTGLIAALLLAVHPFHIEYSQEGRSYVLLMTFVIFAFYRLILFLKEYNIINALFLGIACGLITNVQPIGIINILSIFVIISAYFIVNRKTINKSKFIINSIISGVVTLIIFVPVYQIVEKLSNYPSFWVTKPTFDYVNFVLMQVSGGSFLLFYLFLISMLAFFFFTIFKKEKDFTKKYFTFLIVFIWVFFYFFFILIKSLGSSSLMLHRYLSPILPGMIIILALIIDYIKNIKIKAIVVFSISSLFVYTLIFQNDYYHKRVKAQFNDLCVQINNENKHNETIVSNWGWLLTYFLDRSSETKNVYEKNLNNYINDVKTNSVIQENFWYVDGNSRPYVVEPQTQEFLDKNYFLEKTIELHDCWARYYISKKLVDSNNKTLKLNQFKNAQFDGGGNLMFWENSKTSSLPIQLERGNYSIEISCLSQPKKIINNENAKFTVFINDKNYGNFEASENQTEVKQINYVQKTNSKIQLDIAFLNDFSKDNLDRNLQISKIEIKLK